MVFNPILLDLKNKAESVGYKLGDYSYVTLPYADDFCLITTNLKTHQRLISDISDKITSMGMMLKPSKCRSVSISSGKSKVVPFLSMTSRSPVSEMRNKSFWVNCSSFPERQKKHFPTSKTYL